MTETRTPDPARPDRLLAGVLTLCGLAASIVCLLRSPEGLHHFDDLTHYQFARWAWRWPAYLLDAWGRPGFTVAYFLPAALGWTACRLLSAVLTAATAWLAADLARGVGLRHAWAVVPLCFAQPLFFQLSQTTLTETPLAFYLTLATWLAWQGRWSWSSAVLSVGLVTRHEAVLFIPIWVFFAFREGVPLWRLWPLAWAPALVNLLAPLAGLRPALLQLFAPRPSSQYGQGGWLTFLCRALEAWGPGVTVAAGVGLTGLRGLGRRGRWLALCAALYFAAQTAIRALGLYDSGGYARFLVPISPLIAVLALHGWQRLTQADPAGRAAAVRTAAATMTLLWVAMERQLQLHATTHDLALEVPRLSEAKLAMRLATLAFVLIAAGAWWLSRRGLAPRSARHGPVGGLAAMMVLTCLALCGPLPRPAEADIINEMLVELRAHGLDNRPILSANAWVDFATRQELPPDRPSVRKRLESAPIGALLVWDRQFAGSQQHGLALAEFEQSPAFRLILVTRPAPGGTDPYLRVFEKVSPWGARPN